MSGSQTPPTINFTQIPYGLLVPGTYLEVDANYTHNGLVTFPARALIIGQLLGTGAAVAGQIYTIYRTDQAVQLFGGGSVCADMAASWLLANPYTPLDMVGLAAAVGATAASGLIALTGAPTLNSTLTIGMAGYRVSTVVSTSDTPTTIAANLIAASLLIQGFPFTLATNGTAGQIVCTALNKGACGNELDIRANPGKADLTPPGVNVAITAMAGGAGIPNIAPVLAAISSTWYTDLVCAFTDPATLALLGPVLSSRYTAMGKLDTHAYIGWRGTLGTLASDAAGFDSQYVSAIGASNAQQPSWVWSASLGAVCAYNLTNDPARQLRGIVLPGIIAPNPLDTFYETEQQTLLTDGIVTWDVAPDGTVILQRVVTTYTISILGVPDSAWRDIMVPKTMTRIRYDWRSYVSLTYPNNKLADDGSLAAEYDPSVVTPRTMANSWAGRLRLYEQYGWIENSAQSAQQSVFVRSASDRNTLEAQQYLQIIGNLMVLEGQLLFAATA